MSTPFGDPPLSRTYLVGPRKRKGHHSRRVSIPYWRISSRRCNSKCILSRRLSTSSNRIRIRISISQMVRTRTDSKALCILPRVSAQRPETGQLRMFAKDKPKAVSSQGRIATPTSYSKARTATWWANQISHRSSSLPRPPVAVTRDLASLPNNSNKLSFKNNFNKSRWSVRIKVS